MVEEWKPVVGYEGIYAVSNLSNVKSLAHTRVVHSQRWNTVFTQYFKERILIPLLGSNGRFHFNLHKNGKSASVSRANIVARAWVDGYAPGLEVNHIDENPQNDSVNNLEWCTHLYNMRYGTRTTRAKMGLIKAKAKAVRVYTKTGELISEHRTIANACRIYHCSSSNVAKCCQGKIKSLAGYIWKYV